MWLLVAAVHAQTVHLRDMERDEPDFAPLPSHVGQDAASRLEQLIAEERYPELVPEMLFRLGDLRRQEGCDAFLDERPPDGPFAQAKAAYRAFLTRAPEHPLAEGAWYGLGHIAWHEGQVEEARAALGRAEGLPRAHGILGDLALDADDDPGAALAHYRAAGARREAAWCLHLLGRDEEALAELADVPAPVARAVYLLSAGRVEEGLAAMEEIPGTADDYLLLERPLRLLARSDDAALRAWTARFPDRAVPALLADATVAQREAAAETCEALGEIGLAVQLRERVAADPRAPDRGAALWALAADLEAIAAYDEAARRYDEAALYGAPTREAAARLRDPPPAPPDAALAAAEVALDAFLLAPLDRPMERRAALVALAVAVKPISDQDDPRSIAGAVLLGRARDALADEIEATPDESFCPRGRLVAPRQLAIEVYRIAVDTADRLHHHDAYSAFAAERLVALGERDALDERLPAPRYRAATSAAAARPPPAPTP